MLIVFLLFISDIGHMVFFSGGKIVHGGLPVIAGVRYILPVFLFISSFSHSRTALAKHKLEESVAGDNNNEEVNTWIKGWEAPAQKKETKKPKIDFTGKESGGKSHTFSFEF